MNNRMMNDAAEDDAVVKDATAAAMLSSHPLTPPGCVPTSLTTPSTTSRVHSTSSESSRTPRPANQPQPPTPMSPPPVPRTPVPNNPNINSGDDDDERGRYDAIADSPLGTQSASVQLLSESPLLLVFDHFLSPTECDGLMAG